MTPTHTRKGGRLYRYYVSTDVLKRDAEACPVRRVPAAEIEGAVVDQVRGLLRSPEIIVRTWRAARHRSTASTEAEVREALQRLDPLWDELFPAEQARIVQLLVERVDVSPDGVDIRLRTEGLANLVADLRAIRPGIPEGSVMDRAEGQQRWPHHHRARADFDPEARRPKARARARRHERYTAPRPPSHRQRHGQGDRAGVPLAGDAGERHARDHRGDRRRREDQRVLRRSRPAADPAGAGYR